MAAQLRSGGDRRGPRRIRGGDPGRPARDEGGLRREGPHPGGTCLNVGCIPSKALLDSSELFHLAKQRFGKHGIKVDGIGLDLAAMLARKDEVVKGLTDGVRFLFKQEQDRDDLRDRPGQLADLGPGRAQRGRRASTSRPSTSCWRPGRSRSTCRSCRSTARRSSTRPGRSSFDKVPDHLVVVGAGYIGLELGSVWQRLGAKVTVIEFLPRIVPTGRPARWATCSRRA